MADEIIPIPFGRRVAIIAGLTLFAQALLALFDLLVNLLMAYSVLPGVGFELRMLIRFAMNFVVLAGIFAILRQAQTRLMQSQPTWLNRVTEMSAILGLTAALILARIVPRSVWDASTDQTEVFSGFSMALSNGLIVIWFIAACLIWLWWCNSPPRRERLLGVTALAFVGFELFTGFLDFLLPSVLVIFSQAAEHYGDNRVFSIPGSKVSAILQVSSGFRVAGENAFALGMFRYVVINAALALVAAMIALIVYRVVNRAK